MFCGKCGKELDENGVCSQCDTKAVVEDTPIVPMEKFDSGSNQVKPLVSAAWFAPVAFVAPSIVGGIAVGILNSVASAVGSSLFSYDYTVVTIINAIAGVISALLSAALVLGATYFFYKMAFKSVDPELKKKCELIFFLPFVGIWLSNVLAGVLVTPVTSILVVVLNEAGIYDVATVILTLISIVATLVIDVAVAGALFVLSKKILTKIEENN